MTAERFAGSTPYWIATATYTLVLFATQPFLGYGIDAFKARWGEDGLERSVTAVLVASAALLALLLFRAWSRGSWQERAVLFASLLLYGLGTRSLEIPQERLHFLEYGLLAGLVYVGLSTRMRGWLRPAAASLLVGGSLGLLDELLQILWPRRYFDWRDVLLNLEAALLGLMVAVPAWKGWLRHSEALIRAAEARPDGRRRS